MLDDFLVDLLLRHIAKGRVEKSIERWLLAKDWSRDAYTLRRHFRINFFCEKRTE